MGSCWTPSIRKRTPRTGWRQRSLDLQKLLAATQERIARRLDNQHRELEESADREKYKIYGDLLATNMYSIQKGDRRAVVQNYYEEGYPEVEIQLDPRLTPNQNVQKYYNEYRKRDTAEKKLREQIASGGAGSLPILSRCPTCWPGPRPMRTSLPSAGSCPRRGTPALCLQGGRRRRSCRRCDLSQDDGFTILVGRNNVQNDRLDPAGEPWQ